MKYKIALTNVIWTPDYQNVRRFGSVAEQKTYFGLPALMENLPIRNLDGGTFTRLSIYVKTGEAGIGEIMGNNYAILYDIVAGKYWYYFIINATFDSVTQVRLDLEMDVIQSYYLDMTFGDSIIERAHLNRWNGNTLINSKDSAFLTRDEIKNLPKYIASTKKAVVSPFAPNHEVSQWLDKYCLGWVYAYLDPSEYDVDGTTFSNQLAYIKGESLLNTNISSPYVVVCAPILKATALIGLQMGTTASDLHLISLQNLMSFINDNQANVYAIKISPICPFTSDVSYSFTDIGILEHALLNIYSTIDDRLPKVICGKIANVKYQYLTPQNLTQTYTLPQVSILKNGITTYDEDLNANPKIYNDDYCGLKILYGGNEYVFDIQKLNTGSSSTIGFKFFEILTPEIAPTYIGIDGTDSIYNDTLLNRIGYMGQNDLSLPYSKNQLDVFLANNKNFFAQKETGYNRQRALAAVGGISSLFNGLAGAGMGAMTGNTGGAIASGIGSIGGIFTRAFENELSISYDKDMTNYTLDNMQAGIDSLANSNSNVCFMLGISDFKILIEEIKGLSNDYERALEDMHEYGFTYGRMGNIKAFDNIRSKFNYIRAIIDIIKTPVKIPNDVRSKIKQIFANGVRFWNVDDWTLEQINLEN